jgi:hypothetical protein
METREALTLETLLTYLDEHSENQQGKKRNLRANRLSFLPLGEFDRDRSEPPGREWTCWLAGACARRRRASGAGLSMSSEACERQKNLHMVEFTLLHLGERQHAGRRELALALRLKEKSK